MTSTVAGSVRRAAAVQDTTFGVARVFNTGAFAFFDQQF